MGVCILHTSTEGRYVILGTMAEIFRHLLKDGTWEDGNRVKLAAGSREKTLERNWEGAQENVH